MAKSYRTKECFLTCSRCKKQYDMAEVSLQAQRENKRNLYCPHCGKKVATLN